MNIYIHYGAQTYSPELFEDIKNRQFFPKPFGGYWACPERSAYGWKDFCDDEEFPSDTSKAFRFHLSDSANVKHIRKVADLDGLPIHYEFGNTTIIDFEVCKNSGIDAIELHLSDDNADRDLCFALYGWDIDSILIMNKDIIVPI